MATQVAESSVTESRRVVETGFASLVEQFFKLSLDMLFVVGLDGYVKQLNPMCEKTLAYTTKQLLELIHPEDRESTIAQWQQLSQGLDTISFENRCRCQDGSYRWFLWNATFCHEEQLIYAAARNITERKRSQQALQQARDELERRVQERTAELQAANELLKREISERKRTETALRQSKARLRDQAEQLSKALHELQHTQTQLVQAEKMSSLGQLVAGVAHEINNPVTFIYGNLEYASPYIRDLLNLLRLYQQHYPQPVPEIQAASEAIDIDFLIADMPKAISSMQLGAERIRQIILSLRNFSRHDQAQMKFVDIHEGIDSTLLILQNRFKAIDGRPEIAVLKEYGELPKVECYAGQLNQVFMNVLSNALDALEVRVSKNQSPTPTIKILTEVQEQGIVTIHITDNGCGITEEAQSRLFDPFFTTKPVGKGTGLGLSISYQIVVEKHGGQFKCTSELGNGTEFTISIPIWQQGQRPCDDETEG